MPGLSGSPAVDATPITDAAQDVLDAIDTLGAAKRTINGGMYVIPAGLSRGQVTSTHANSNTYGAWAQLQSAAPADCVIVGVLVDPAGEPATYAQVELGVGAASAETSIGVVKVKMSSGASGTGPFRTTPPVMLATPISIEAGVRIAARTASSSGSSNYYITLICVAVADLEDY